MDAAVGSTFFSAFIDEAFLGKRQAKSSDSKTWSFSTSKQSTISSHRTVRCVWKNLTVWISLKANMRHNVLVSHPDKSFDKGAGSAHLIAVATPMMWKPVYWKLHFTGD